MNDPSEDTIGIDAAAPVSASAQVTIAAPAEVVWSVLADIEAWPQWNSEIADARLHGPLTEGTRFSWKGGGMSIESQLVDVSKPASLAWTGKTIGVRAVHVTRFSAAGDGTVAVTEESFAGPLPWLFRRPMRRMLAAAIGKGLEALKAECERRS